MVVIIPNRCKILREDGMLIEPEPRARVRFLDKEDLEKMPEDVIQHSTST